MPSSYTNNLGIELPADGELDAIWGDVVNDNMDILDRAINGTVTLTLSGTSSTLTTSDGTLSDGQYKLLVLAGSPSGTHTITIAPNDAQKIYFVRNTTAQSVVFTQGSGGNVTIATGDSGVLYADGAGAGAAVVSLIGSTASQSANNLSVSGDLTIADKIVHSGDTNTAIRFPAADTVTVETNGAERMRVDSSGNVGIGTTSPASIVGGTDTSPVLSIGGTDSTLTTGDKSGSLSFITNDSSYTATFPDGVTGEIASVAESGTGAAYGLALYTGTTNGPSRAERMRIDRFGNVGIGTTSPADKLHLLGSGETGLRIDDSGTARYAEVTFGTTNAAMVIGSQGGSPYPITFETDSTERMRITSAGNVGIGVTPSAWTSADKVLQFGASGVLRANANTSFSSSGANFYSDGAFKYINTAAASRYDQFAGEHLWYSAPSGTAGNAITFTERMRIDSAGTVLAGKTASNIATAGVELYQDGIIYNTVSGDTCLVINRLASDGTLVSFRQAGTQEGTISVSGTTVSYNGGHLSRWAQLPDNSRPELLKGTVMSNLDQMSNWDGEENEQLNCVQVSDVEGDANVAGVFVAWDSTDDDYNDILLAMTGDMVIRIGAGVTVQRGDLLMSAGDGTAKPQGDDIVRSKTIAKVTSTHVSHTYEDGSYAVPCVLMAC